ncbi:MAG: DUF5717 family protein [Eubacteriales bacterium]|nr:DUF5717 family protein [Eubacteriales bacterium]
MRDFYTRENMQGEAFHVPDAGLVFEPAELSFETETESGREGTIRVRHRAGKPARGYVYPSERCMRGVREQFAPAADGTGSIRWHFDARGIAPGRTVSGSLRVISPYGEYIIPYTVQVSGKGEISRKGRTLSPAPQGGTGSGTRARTAGQGSAGISVRPADLSLRISGTGGRSGGTMGVSGTGGHSDGNADTAGEILDKMDFLRLAETDFRQAAALFYSSRFEEILTGAEDRTLYRGLSMQEGNLQNVEEFLIAACGKEKTLFEPVEKELLLQTQGRPGRAEGRMAGSRAERALENYRKRVRSSGLGNTSARRETAGEEDLVYIPLTIRKTGTCILDPEIRAEGGFLPAAPFRVSENSGAAAGGRTAGEEKDSQGLFLLRQTDDPAAGTAVGGEQAEETPAAGEETVFTAQIPVNRAALHAGRNFGSVLLRGPFNETRIPVEVHCRSTGASIHRRQDRELELLQLQLMRMYVDFRLEEKHPEDWFLTAERLLDRISLRSHGALVPRLYGVHFLILRGQNAEAARELGRIAVRYAGPDASGNFSARFTGETEEAYCYRQYLAARCQPEDVRLRTRVVRFLHGIYRQKGDWRTAWMLMDLADEYAPGTGARWNFLRHQFESGCSSPVILLEAWEMVRRDPQILLPGSSVQERWAKDDFGLHVLWYAARNNVLTPRTAEAMMVLAEKKKTFSPVLFKALCTAYEICDFGLAGPRVSAEDGAEETAGAEAAGMSVYDAPVPGNEVPFTGKDASASGKNAPSYGIDTPASGNGVSVAGKNAPASGNGLSVARKKVPVTGENTPGRAGSVISEIPGEEGDSLRGDLAAQMKKGLLRAVCILLVRSQDLSPRAYSWYTRALEAGVSLTRLEENRLQSMPAEDASFRLPAGCNAVLRTTAARAVQAVLVYDRFRGEQSFPVRNGVALLSVYGEANTIFLEDAEGCRYAKSLPYALDFEKTGESPAGKQTGSGAWHEQNVYALADRLGLGIRQNAALRHTGRGQGPASGAGTGSAPASAAGSRIASAKGAGSAPASAAGSRIASAKGAGSAPAVRRVPERYSANDPRGLRTAMPEEYAAAGRLLDSGLLTAKAGTELLLLCLEDCRNTDPEVFRYFLSKAKPEQGTARERALLLEYLADAGDFETALRWVNTYGTGEIRSELLARISLGFSWEKAAQSVLTAVIPLGWESFTRGCTDGSLLEKLSDFFYGTAGELLQLRTACADTGLSTVQLDRRIVRQALYSSTVTQAHAQVIVHAGRKLEDAFLPSVAQYADYAFSGGISLGNRMTDLIAGLIADGSSSAPESRGTAGRGAAAKEQEEIPDICRIAYLKELSMRHGEISEREKNAAGSSLSALLSKGIIFPFYRQFPGLDDRLDLYAEETLVQYHPAQPEAGNGRKIVFHYAHSRRGETGNYRSRPMKEMYRDFYVSGFLLFYGEQMHYYITDDAAEKHVVQSGIIGQDARILENCSGRFGLINETTRAAALREYDEALSLLTGYYRRSYLENELFRR